MAVYRGQKTRRTWMFFLIIFMTGIIACSCICSADQERTSTEISIALDPATPTVDQEFFITGTLYTSEGDPLGNKWVILESTAAGATPGKFQYLKVTRTELDGSFSFYRPAASPPEDLKVVFKGLYGYAGSESEVVSAKK
ncbi:MAG: hypothetical protein GXY48_07595 [Methanomicrobiales archaeon]|nr:hypothetical protein [Methanomicrobiales archaeon]